MQYWLVTDAQTDIVLQLTVPRQHSVAWVKVSRLMIPCASPLEFAKSRSAYKGNADFDR